MTKQAETRRFLRIGITIGLRSEDESLWINGIKQNAIFLAKAFQNSIHRHQVTLLNTTDVAITDKLAWSQERFPTKSFEAGKDDLDILIELGGQINNLQTDYLKQRGTRIVSYCCGPEYATTSQAIISQVPGFQTPFINQRYDEVWIIPQVAETSFHYLKTLRRRPARVIPFVWDPMCIEQRSRTLPHGGEYRPHSGRAKRLSVIEPNRDLLKFCLYPTFLAELAFRMAPDRIEFLHVTNADRLVKDDFGFVAMVKDLDIVKAHKAAFVGMFATPDFLSEHTDFVVSHQWGLALNYMYLEVCWQGYGLVHNAHIVPDIGYYYKENDVEEGARILLRALEEHDKDWEGYRAQQRKLIGRFLATNPEVSAAYDDLMFDLLAAPPAP